MIFFAWYGGRPPTISSASSYGSRRISSGIIRARPSSSLAWPRLESQEPPDIELPCPFRIVACPSRSLMRSAVRSSSAL
jgi:hypothetical protein